MTHADTDGLLDKCRCGAVAGFEDAGAGFVRARCTECCEQTEPSPSKYQCMLWWNTARRREKRNKIDAELESLRRHAKGIT